MKLCMNEAMFCLRAAGFDMPNVVIGGAIGMAESQLETDAIGRLAGADGIFDNEDLGWMQISTKWHEAKIVSLTGANWRDPFINAILAKQAWDEFVRAGKPGWTAWSVFGSKAFEKWLPMARNAESHLWAPTPDGATLIWNRRLAS